MRKIAALAALTCLLGGALAQTMFTGEGYSSSQLAFSNAPTTSVFEPNVEKYWSNYIANAQNLTANGAAGSMDIWLNSFPLGFNSPLQIKDSSFNIKPSVPALGATELNSQSLTRDVNDAFNIYQISSIAPVQGSFSTSNSSATPGKDSSGKILSQGIISQMNV